MKVFIYEKYGSPEVLQLKELEKPTPKDDEVLVKVHAAAVNPLDWHFMRGTPYFMRLMVGFLKPKNKFLGVDMAGTVEAVGRHATQFKVGDEVFGDISPGAFAEYTCSAEKLLTHKPADITFKEAAATPVAALTALQGLRDAGELKPGQKVLINGASGGVGTYAVQIAKALGAEVTAVCSTRNVEIVRSIGADRVIDYTQEDFTQSNELYDLILDNAASRTIAEYMQVLKPGGRCVLVGFSMSLMVKVGIFGRLISKRYGKTITMMSAKAEQDDLLFFAQLFEKGQLSAVIDRCYPLAELPQAIAYLEEGHAQGKVVISVLEA
ncbi:MAG: NADPH:quinone reductase-like Zn-dependent oxidoreductase [Cellvibrionaceae bacterium]|jgi:NADPH:quinone reductase-like Zn-dependent oxidoreductase